ncbi:hypothetical protein R3X26_17475 [Vibrio sp. TH_r3]|uniref:hypothetical protein n=1 Tax=Vibrio sp. TH_r3 TaxID=3082084 RepID=UPI002952BAA5|nr:hypothetical protein [Vibrio sp. TH_r3]MDV7106189.1 hypothetical protein [Vibrio sp. TH_r3]
MSNKSTEKIIALRMILLALDDVIKSGAKPRYEGDDSSTNPESFKKLVMQLAGDRVSESVIDEALKIPLQEIALELMKQSRS